jgi:very-short-patch-repair endonuclease
LAHFYRAEAKLAIENDGDARAAPDQAAYDAARTSWLEERGSKAIRFDAAEVSRNLAGVVEAIRAACEIRTSEP